MLKAGGGWISPRLEVAVLEEHPARKIYRPEIYKDFSCQCVEYAPSPEVLRVADTAHFARLDRSQFHLLPVALGLSFWTDWPDWYRPSEARPVPPDEEELVPVDPTWGHS